MAAAPMKSPLHNFPLTFLKWGSKNHQQRCRRSPFESSNAPPNPSGSRGSHRSTPEPQPQEAHLASARAPELEDAEGEGEKPWNLRPRRAPASKSRAPMKAPLLSIEREASENLPKSMRLRGFEAAQGGEGGGGGGGSGGERREKRKFWIALSREEIEEDIYSLTGSRPSRRPRKRPRNLQKQLDNVFPGLWLVGISPEAYRCLDLPPKR